MKDYSLHPVLERARIDDYQHLFNVVYGNNEKLTSAYLRWLYQDNPDGVALGVDAFSGDELVAHYVTIPRRYRVGVQQLRILLSANTATHPDHQRRGLFKTLAKATYELGVEQGFAAVIGIANAQSVYGFTNSLSFEHLGQVRMTLRRTPPEPLVGSAALDLNPGWLAWRFANPSARYELLGEKSRWTVIGTRRGRVRFTIGAVPTMMLGTAALQLERTGFGLVPRLMPVFPVDGMYPLLPLSLQPSPWHVILKSLVLGSDMEQLRRITFDGLAMDTF